MIGNLEPEENVMAKPKPITTYLMSKTNSNDWMGKLVSAFETLKWRDGDELCVKIGGVANSGIHQAEGANPKWAKPFGTVTCQSDAFIVIENVTRNPFVPSQPNPDLKSHNS